LIRDPGASGDNPPGNPCNLRWDEYFPLPPVVVSGQGRIGGPFGPMVVALRSTPLTHPEGPPPPPPPPAPQLTPDAVVAAAPEYLIICPCGYSQAPPRPTSAAGGAPNSPLL